LELACKDIVFHFNKGHIADQTIPMWVLKTHGESYYVHHVDCRLPWNTKETPDNPATKGSIKIKESLLTIDDENNATISELTLHDKSRLNNAKKGITRIVVSEKNFGATKLRDLLKDRDIKHGPIKSIGGACTTTFYVTDIHNETDVLYLALMLSDTDFRKLMPNEGYYKYYDDPKYQGTSDIDLDAIDWSDEDDDD
jgi:hypothetical protein